MKIRPSVKKAMERLHIKEPKKNQLKIINSVLDRHDTMVIAPTSYGKSLLYQIPAVIQKDSMTIVVEPLLALIHDQVQKLQELNISAAYLDSTQSDRERKDVIDNLRDGKIQILYMAPERLEIVPHPPLIVPTVGRGQEWEVQSTIDAYRAAARQVATWGPEVLVVTTPHLVMYSDYFHISPGKGASGDLSAFGALRPRIETAYDKELRGEIIRQAEAAGIRTGTLGERDRSLDHGTFLPLYFLQEAGVNCPIVRIGLSGFPPLEHYRLGQCIAKAVDKLGRRAVFVASGDLSHKLRDDGPYGYAPEGPDFDKRMTRAMAGGDFLQFLTMDPGLCDRAAECGLRSFQIMAGALDGLALDAKLLSYEGPFGVGYGVATFTVIGLDENRRFARKYEEAERARLAERKAAEDPWVRLARMSLETFVRTGNMLDTLPDGLPGEMTDRTAGAFVSLHAHGQLRGCIGTTGPTTPSVAWEIVQNAVSACSRDPRFVPVRADELDSLEYSVDVLGEPEAISSPAELDVKRYGVIVSCGGRRGLLLPDLDGVDTVEQQIDIARQKGGIGPRERYTLERFEVVRHV